MEPLIFSKNSFSGGINQQVDATRIGANEYPLLVNGRTRYDVVEAINAPQMVTSGLPLGGKYQGCYAAGSYLLVFISGEAYYQDYETPGAFTKIIGFLLDTTVEYLYAEQVPASTVNFLRATASGATSITDSINFTSTTSPSPQAVVIQDGINQPWIIFPDGTARLCGTYATWLTTNREYVPVGKQMLFANGILYVISADGKLIFRSVSGRPLDFMVAINSTGDKISPDELLGGARVVSHAVDYDVITCIKPSNTETNAVFVSTLRNSFLVVPSFELTVYGEPTFKNTYLFSTGVNNQFSFADVLGDSAFIDHTGIRQFNAVLSTRNEGKNSPFSAKLNPIFRDVAQGVSATGELDNYTFFSVNTIYGPAVLVFDTLARVFSSVDIYAGIGPVKMFAQIKTSTTRRLFFITSDNALYEAFASAAFETASLYIGEFCSNDPSVEQKLDMLKLVFIDALESGAVTVKLFVDRLEDKTQSENILQNTTPSVVPVSPLPFGAATSDTVRNLLLKFSGSRQGWKVGFLISWNFDVSLSHVKLMSNPITPNNSFEQQAR